MYIYTLFGFLPTLTDFYFYNVNMVNIEETIK